MIELFLQTGLAGLMVAQPSIPATAPFDQERVEACREIDFQTIGRNPRPAELRCRFDVRGPGRFGLLSHTDVPVYQPVTPMPGTHMIGVPGQPRPLIFETFEQWEWRVLGASYGPEAERIHRDIDLLDPGFAAIIRTFEDRLADSGVRAARLETWRAPARQAFLFQQGRSRSGPLVTTTLTSWHSQMDAAGRPAGRAVDYDVDPDAMRRFHQIATELGLVTYGHDSHDPGHVYLPLTDERLDREIVYLRTIPRVPEVTLATGLPVDRSLPPGGGAALREKSRAFAARPFIPFPVPSLAAHPLRTEIILSLDAPVEPPAAETTGRSVSPPSMPRAPSYHSRPR